MGLGSSEGVKIDQIPPRYTSTEFKWAGPAYSRERGTERQRQRQRQRDREAIRQQNRQRDRERRCQK